MYCEVRLEPFVFSVSTDDYFFTSPPGTRPIVHNHASFEFQYIFEGTGSIKINEKTIYYQPGTFFLVPPFAYHCDTSRNIKKYMFQFVYRKYDTLKAGFVSDEAQKIETAIIDKTEQAIIDTQGIGSLIEQLHNEASRKMTGHQFYINNIFSNIILCMIRAFVEEKADDESKDTGVLSDDKRREDIDVFFGTRYHQPITPGQLAKKLMVSTRQLSRILKQLYDKSFKKSLWKPGSRRRNIFFKARICL